MFVVNTGFFMSYATWDKFAFLLPSFLVLAFCGALGIDAVVAEVAGRRHAALAAVLFAASAAAPVALYSRLSAWAPDDDSFLGRKFGRGHAGNTHDVGEYIANPDKRRYREFEVFLDRLFTRLPPNAVFVDDDARTYYPILYYQKYEGRRRDLSVALVNVWGFKGWGIDQAAFQELLEAGYSGARRVFLVSVAHPYGPWIVASPASDRYRFRRFPLGDGRWVYELLSASDAAAIPVEPPPFTGMVVGQGFASPATASARAHFGPAEKVAVAVAFELNSEPFPLRFRWIRPDGSALEGETMTLPFGCTDAWAELGEPPPLAPGKWRVVAVAAGKPVASSSFEVAAQTRAKSM